ncbi:MAG: hypothetical protein PHP98_02100 [Kiritimatiellae bacterium]|nr:hypothetical protein [Kiritimatiellia bacterium]
MEANNEIIFHSDSPKLAELMGPPEKQLWRPEELAAVFRHQLSAPVQFDLAGLNSRLREKIRLLAVSQGLLLKSFGDLLRHPHPPVKLLVMVKDFAKRTALSPNGPLPPEIAKILYYSAIAAAILRCSRRITTLDDTSLRRGMEWAILRPWIDSDTRALLQSCLNTLE